MLSRFEPGPMMVQLMEESIQSAAGPREPQAVPPSLLVRPEAAGNWVPLPPPLTAGAPLMQVLASRTAIRSYSSASLSLAELGTLLATAVRGDRKDWPAETAAGVPLRLLVLAWRVEGLTDDAPGLYEYDPDKQALRFVNTAPPPGEADALFIQQEFANAAVVITVVSNLAAAVARHGSYGHRLLLMRAGAAAHRAWLSGLSFGLVGTVFAGFIAAPLRELAEIYGYQDAQLFALALGRPST